MASDDRDPRFFLGLAAPLALVAAAGPKKSAGDEEAVGAAVEEETEDATDVTGMQAPAPDAAPVSLLSMCIGAFVGTV